MAEFDALENAIEKFAESVAEFPIGAVSLNDLKPTEEKIQDLRVTLKKLCSAIVILRAKEAARTMSNVPEESVQETYDKLQDEMVHCAINKEAVGTCLFSNALEPILRSTNDTEIKRILQDLMKSLFDLNDKLMGFEAKRSMAKEREKQLTIELKESLLEFNDFLKEQKDIRNQKLEETNPQIAEQKAQMQKRVERINVTKRLITNMIAASGEHQQNPFFQEIMKKHRELVDPEMIAKMAQEKPDEEP